MCVESRGLSTQEKFASRVQLLLEPRSNLEVENDLDIK